MLTDVTTVDLGGEIVKIRRLTLGEIRADRELAASGDAALIDERREKMIRDNVKMANGSPIDPEKLSLPQMRRLMKELVGLPGDGGITDFIGLLC